MTVTLTITKLPEDAKLHPVCTEDSWNYYIFKDCIELGCLPLMSFPSTRRFPYYLVHHEEVVLYNHDSEASIKERQETVKAWLHSHHQRLQALLERG